MFYDHESDFTFTMENDGEGTMLRDAFVLSCNEDATFTGDGRGSSDFSYSGTDYNDGPGDGMFFAYGDGMGGGSCYDDHPFSGGGYNSISVNVNFIDLDDFILWFVTENLRDENGSR